MVLILLLGLIIPSTGYYLSNHGDDSRTVQQAQSPKTPWKSLSRLQTEHFMPGDSILLHKGDVFFESANLTLQGSSTSPIRIGSYGTGSPPRLTGTAPLNGCEQNAGNSFVCPFPPEGSPSRLYYQGNQIPMTRYPEKGWLRAKSTSGNSLVADRLPSDKNWQGGILMIRSSEFTLEPRQLIRQIGDTLFLQRKTSYPLQKGTRFFAIGFPKDLTPGTWAMDALTKKIWWSPLRGQNPKDITASVREGLLLDHSQWVTVKGLRFTQSRGYGIKINGDNILVEDCEILDADQDGILARGNHNLFKHCSIRGTNHGGIRAWGSGIQVQNFSVTATAMLQKITLVGLGDECCGGKAIDVSGDSLVIHGNTVDSTGYHGIGVSSTSGLIENNRVAHSCLTNDDCAGMYIGSGPSLAPAGTRTRVRNNTVLDSKADGPGANGIYLDDLTHDVLVEGNTSNGNDRGLYLHNTQNIVAVRNTFLHNRLAPIDLTHDRYGRNQDMTGNRIDSNLLEGGVLAVNGIRKVLEVPQNLPLYSESFNTVCQDLVIAQECRRDGKLVSRKATNIKLGTNVLAWGKAEKFFTHTSWPDLVQTKLGKPSDCGLTPCLEIEQPYDSLKRASLVNDGHSFPIEAGQVWILRFEARSKSPKNLLTAILRRAIPNYGLLAPTQTVVLDTTWSEQTVVVRPNRSDPKARLDFQFSSDGAHWWIKEVRLERVLER